MARSAAQKLVHNEQTKLLATYVNSIAVTLFGAGVVAPLIGVISAAGGWQPLQLALVAASCMLLSGTLHLVARVLLRGLDQ